MFKNEEPSNIQGKSGLMKVISLLKVEKDKFVHESASYWFA